MSKMWISLILVLSSISHSLCSPQISFFQSKNPNWVTHNEKLSRASLRPLPPSSVIIENSQVGVIPSRESIYSFKHEGITPQSIITGCEGITYANGRTQIQFYIIDASGHRKIVSPGSSLKVDFPGPLLFYGYHRKDTVNYDEMCFPKECGSQVCGYIVGPVKENEETEGADAALTLPSNPSTGGNSFTIPITEVEINIQKNETEKDGENNSNPSFSFPAVNMTSPQFEIPVQGTLVGGLIVPATNPSLVSAALYQLSTSVNATAPKQAPTSGVLVGTLTQLPDSVLVVSASPNGAITSSSVVSIPPRTSQASATANLVAEAIRQTIGAGVGIGTPPPGSNTTIPPLEGSTTAAPPTPSTPPPPATTTAAPTTVAPPEITTTTIAPPPETTTTIAPPPEITSAPPPETTTTTTTPPPATTTTTTTTTAPPPETTTTAAPPPETTTSTTTPPPTTTTTAAPPPETTTTAAPPPETTTSTTTPPPTTTTTAAPPPETTTTAAPPPETTTTAAPPPDTTTTAAPPPDTTTTAAPPPDTTTTAAPPPETTTTAAPPPDTTTTAAPPPETTTTAAPPPDTTTTAAPPPETTTLAPPPETTTTTTTTTTPAVTTTTTVSPPPEITTTTISPETTTTTTPPPETTTTPSTPTPETNTTTTTPPPETTTCTPQPSPGCAPANQVPPQCPQTPSCPPTSSACPQIPTPVCCPSTAPPPTPVCPTQSVAPQCCTPNPSSWCTPPPAPPAPAPCGRTETKQVQVQEIVPAFEISLPQQLVNSENSQDGKAFEMPRTDVEYYAALPGAVRGDAGIVYYPSCDRNAFRQHNIIPFCFNTLPRYYHDKSRGTIPSTDPRLKMNMPVSFILRK